jgi:hypothetical protein
MTTDELSAREELRELVASYTHLGDSGRLDELVALFEPDAWLDADRVRYEGPDGIGSFFRGIVRGREATTNRTYVRHHIANVTLTLDGPDTASGASYWTVYSDDGFESSGRYRDTYHRDVDGRWRFSSRTIRRDQPRTVAAPETAAGVAT